MAKKVAMAPYEAKCFSAMPASDGLFSVDQGMADRINMKSKLFKEEGKSKEFCETQYYNKVFGFF